MPLVSIIVVNYNGEGLIKDCFSGLKNQSFKDFEIIVIDNASSDGSLCEIQKYLEKYSMEPLIKIISLSSNSGFTGGNIEGKKHAKGEYIALLNNDTQADEMWLEELVKAMDNDPTIMNP